MLGSRLWRVMRRVFARAADVTQADHPVLGGEVGCQVAVVITGLFIEYERVLKCRVTTLPWKSWNARMVVLPGSPTNPPIPH